MSAELPRLRCPTCRGPLDAQALGCPAGHRYGFDDGVLVLLSADFAARLRAFLSGFTALRAAAGKRILDPREYPRLPAGQHRPDDRDWSAEWRMRGYDLQLIQRLLGRAPTRSVLEIGGYNGWLSNHLAAAGHAVTALDFFVDEHDGLAAKKFYPASWLAIQMDLDDLSILDQQYECVILNRCLQFGADPAAYVRQAMERLAPGGLLIATGLAFFRDPRPRRRAVEALRAELQGHGLDFFRPMQGYLDLADRARLEAAGLRVRPYPQLRLANLRTWLRPDRPWHAYGVGARS
jgi:SAM-dependent methyltransferase